MQLTLTGERHTLIPIQAFRAAHKLPAEFGVNAFEPKDYTGLAKLDAGGVALDTIRERLLDALPESVPLADLLQVLPGWCDLFRTALESVNEIVNLKQVEIDFAVNGFESVLRSVAFDWIRARAQSYTPPSFTAIYAAWLDDSVRVSAQVHVYGRYTVQIINTAYGRAGLIVRWADTVAYVRDGALGCPAEGFMVGLLRHIAQKIEM